MRWLTHPVRSQGRHLADPPAVPPTRDRRGRRWAAVVGVVLLTVSTVVGIANSSKAAEPTIISLTFDDGNGSQLAAAQVLKAHGLAGTFYITTSFIDSSGFLTRGNLHSLAADGHEIGGHSVTHPYMTTIGATAAREEACDSKTTLEGWGFTVRNFA